MNTPAVTEEPFTRPEAAQLDRLYHQNFVNEDALARKKFWEQFLEGLKVDIDMCPSTPEGWVRAYERFFLSQPRE